MYCEGKISGVEKPLELQCKHLAVSPVVFGPIWRVDLHVLDSWPSINLGLIADDFQQGKRSFWGPR